MYNSIDMVQQAKPDLPPGAIEIRLFGELSILRAGRPVQLPASKKTRALFAYLVTSQRSHTRERLCDFLWEGPDDPRAALRWSLAKIRPLVDEPGTLRLVADRERVAFEARGAITDLHDLRVLASKGLEASATHGLELAAESVKGELLEGLDLPDCYQYNEWCRAERESARKLARSIRIALIARFESEPEKALVHARALIAADPLDQLGHAAVIRILAGLSRSKEALQQYDTCRHILNSQHQGAPSIEVEQARMAIRASQLPSFSSPIAISSASIAESLVPVDATTASLHLSVRDCGFDKPKYPLVGRESECKILGEYLSGNATEQLLLILGEPGAGKSRLLSELAGLVYGDGGRVLRGRAFEAEVVRPYGAWLDALRAIESQFDTPGPFFVHSETPFDAAMDRSRLFESVVDRLLRLDSDGKATLVIIDDIQWLDEGSAALIHYAARAVAGSRVRIACAARPGELGDNFAALRLVRTLTRSGKIRQIGLSPLDAERTAELARSANPNVDAARVFEESGGNPMYALEIARALDGGEGPTSSLDAMLQDRLERLEGDSRALVSWAAIFGSAFPLDSLLNVAEMATGDFLRAIEELERRSFLRPVNVSGSETRYDFVHDLLRRAAYQAMSEPRRRLMHLTIARSLEKSPEARGSLAGDIAHHATLGDDPHLAVRFSLAAGERCLSMCAAREAAELAERGLRHLARIDVNDRARLEVALLSVAIIADVGRRSTQTLEGLMRQALAKAQAAGFTEEVARGLMALSYLHFDRGNFHEAQLDSLRMSEAGRSSNPNQTIQVLAHAAQCLAMLERDMAKAEALAHEAKSLAQQQDLEVMELLLAQGFILLYQGEQDAGLEFLRRASLLAEQQGVYWLGAICLLRLARGELQRGYPAKALEYCSRLRAIVGRLGEASEGPLGEIIEAVARRQIGEPVSRSCIDRALNALVTFDAQAYLGEAHCMVAESDLEAGDVVAARCQARLALRAAEAVERTTYIVWSRALLAHAAHAMGDFDEAREHIEAALPLLAAEPLPSAGARQWIARAIKACARESLSMPVPLQEVVASMQDPIPI